MHKTKEFLFCSGLLEFSGLVSANSGEVWVAIREANKLLSAIQIVAYNLTTFMLIYE